MTDLIWTPIKIRLGQIIPWSENPRMSTKAQAQRLIKSERELGQIQTLAVSPFTEDNRVHLYDGHQRVSAFITVKGAEFEVTALQSNRMLTEDERKKVSVLLHTATGSWSWDALSSWSAADLREWGMDEDTLKGWNNDANNLKELLNAEGEEPVDAEPQIDRAAELAEKWHTATGQLWKLGDHRLLIGDCTVRENVERLMGGERASMCFTSPPYGSKSGNLSGVKFYGTKDKDTFEDYVGFLCNFLLVAPVENDSPVLVNLSYNDNQRKALFEFAVSDKHGFELYETFIWKKIRSMPLKGDNISRLCEFVFLFSKDRYKIYNREAINLGLFNFYETKKENKQNRETGNLATFPVDFPEHFINLFSSPNFIIYEPFAGSGTTIIAAHNLNRRCFAMEISEKYGAVILERFYSATGITPELVE